MIAFIGDSYCVGDHGPSYVTLLGKNLNMPVIQLASSGCSWWSSRVKMLDALKRGLLKETKIVVFVHTEIGRIHEPTGLPMNSSCVESKMNNPASVDGELYKAGHLYFKYLYNKEFAIWSQQQWINECVTFFDPSVYIIHMHSFPWDIKSFASVRDLDIRTGLYAISSGEYRNDEEHLRDTRGRDTRPNHMNDANNFVLATLLTNYINNKTIGQVGLSSSDFELKSSTFFE